MNAAAPVTCGQAMDVPDLKAYVAGFSPAGMPPGLSGLGNIAAKTATPGAATSG